MGKGKNGSPIYLVSLLPFLMDEGEVNVESVGYGRYSLKIYLVGRYYIMYVNPLIIEIVIR